jgi:prepilin-type N-terminal cleavage/methylation domain-containing protein
MSSQNHNRLGMTLIEVLVSLTLLTIVLGAVYSILNLQLSRSFNVQTTATLQSDAQVALSIFRWDIFMAGYGMARDTNSLISLDYSNQPDNITLYAAGLAFESRSANWSPILENTMSSNRIIVFNFPDSAQNMKVGDRLILVGQDKKLLDSGLVVGSVDSVDHYAGNDTIPALRLSLNRNVTVGQGAITFAANPTTYFNGVTYSINNTRQLLRGNDVFLDNVEDLQFSYGYDLNDNGAFETNEWHNSLNAIPGYRPQMLYDHKFSVRATFVMRSDRKLRNYTSWAQGYNIDADNVQVENHQYSIQATKDYRREYVCTITWPRNIRF